MVLLIACRMRARALGMTKLEPKIQEKITFMDSKTGESIGCRLIASESVREVFEQMAADTWNGDFTSIKKLPKRKLKKIKPIYDEFVKRLSEFGKTELSEFLGAIYDSYVARIEVESEVEALNIFERTNARGLDLEISDLLKNHLFTKKVDSIEELWQNIVSNSHGTILRMLKYFYVSRKGYVLKPQLYKKLKLCRRLKPQQFTKELAHFSEFYAVVKNPSKIAIKDFFEESEFFLISNDQYRYGKN